MATQLQQAACRMLAIHSQVIFRKQLNVQSARLRRVGNGLTFKKDASLAGLFTCDRREGETEESGEGEAPAEPGNRWRAKLRLSRGI